MVAVTDQLSAPPASCYQEGKNTLNRIHVCEASAAAPVTPTNIEFVTGVEWGEPTFGLTAEILHQGAGYNRTEIERQPRWDGTITVLGGKIGTVLAQIQNLTWSAAAVALSSRKDDDYAKVHWEAVVRDSDNTTHLFSIIIPDMVIDDIGVSNMLDYSERTIPFHTYSEPFLLYTGYELEYNVWDATPSTPTYNLGTSTPATLLTASNHTDWHFDNAVSIKLKDNSAGQTVGVKLTSGVSISGNTLTFASNTPAASDTVYALVAKAS